MSCLHRGPPYIQRGRGVGGTLSSMFKGVVPAMKIMGEKILATPAAQDVLKTGANSVLEGGLNIAKDTLRGRNFKESVSENVTSAKKAVTKSLRSALKQRGGEVANVGVGVKRKREATVPTLVEGEGRKSKKKKRNYGDLFEEDFV